MYKNGHRGINALLYAPIAAAVIHFTDIILAIIGAVIFIGVARLPDLDRHFDNNMNSNRSKLWQYIPISHRGFTHTIWFALLLSPLGSALTIILGTAYTTTYPVELFAVYGGTLTVLGLTGHLIGDMITPAGIHPFKPLSDRKIGFGFVNASNTIANYGFLIIGGITLLTVLGWGFNQTNPETLIP